MTKSGKSRKHQDFRLIFCFLWSFTGLRSNTFFSAQEKVFLCGAVNSRPQAPSSCLTSNYSDRSPCENRVLANKRSSGCKYASFEPFCQVPDLLRVMLLCFVDTDKVASLSHSNRLFHPFRCHIRLIRIISIPPKGLFGQVVRTI